MIEESKSRNLLIWHIVMKKNVMISIYVYMNLDMILNKVFNTLVKYQKWCYIPTIYVDISKHYPT